MPPLLPVTTISTPSGPVLVTTGPPLHMPETETIAHSAPQQDQFTVMDGASCERGPSHPENVGRELYYTNVVGNQWGIERHDVMEVADDQTVETTAGNEVVYQVHIDHCTEAGLVNTGNTHIQDSGSQTDAEDSQPGVADNQDFRSSQEGRAEMEVIGDSNTHTVIELKMDSISNQQDSLNQDTGDETVEIDVYDFMSTKPQSSSVTYSATREFHDYSLPYKGTEDLQIKPTNSQPTPLSENKKTTQKHSPRKSVRKKAPVAGSTAPSSSRTNDTAAKVPEEDVLKAKVHRKNKEEGELVFVEIGQPLKDYLTTHHLLADIFLNKGKRDIKRNLVQLKRHENAIDVGSWKRGSKVMSRNRLDDCFEVTPEGAQRMQLINQKKCRDEFVVNWYLFCPGHGNCLRRCGGIGVCKEGNNYCKMFTIFITVCTKTCKNTLFYIFLQYITIVIALNTR